MITYLLWGILFTFIFDMILRGTENEFNNIERFGLVLLWPIMLAWFFYFFYQAGVSNCIHVYSDIRLIL